MSTTGWSGVAARFRPSRSVPPDSRGHRGLLPRRRLPPDDDQHDGPGGDQDPENEQGRRERDQEPGFDLDRPGGRDAGGSVRIHDHDRPPAVGGVPAQFLSARPRRRGGPECLLGRCGDRRRASGGAVYRGAVGEADDVVVGDVAEVGIDVGCGTDADEGLRVPVVAGDPQSQIGVQRVEQPGRWFHIGCQGGGLSGDGFGGGAQNGQG